MLREIINEFTQDNPKLGELLLQVLDEIEAEPEKYVGQDISVIINQMRYAAVDKEVERFAKKWYLPVEDVRYEVYNFKDGQLSNENKLKEKVDYATYKAENDPAFMKFKLYSMMIRDFKEELMMEIEPLID